MARTNATAKISQRSKRRQWRGNPAKRQEPRGARLPPKRSAQRSARRSPQLAPARMNLSRRHRSGKQETQHRREGSRRWSENEIEQTQERRAQQTKYLRQNKLRTQRESPQKLARHNRAKQRKVRPRASASSRPRTQQPARFDVSAAR